MRKDHPLRIRRWKDVGKDLRLKGRTRWIGSGGVSVSSVGQTFGLLQGNRNLRRLWWVNRIGGGERRFANKEIQHRRMFKVKEEKKESKRRKRSQVDQIKSR